MQIHEIMSVSAPLLRRLAEAGVKTTDFQFLELYQDYRRLMSEGHKKTYVVAYLSDTYEVSERKVYRMIAKMEQNI